MPRQTLTIATRDGGCPASVFTPAQGAGPWPGVLFLMDGPGIRPALWDMGQRLADAGYLVLMPDLYYRSGPYAPMDPATVFADPEKKAAMLALVGSLDRDRKVADAQAFVDCLAARPDVAGDRFGVVGYCMGGNCALTAAGALPGRFAAVAAFHASRLASDQPDSPHRFVQNIKGRVYVGGAFEDAHFTDEDKARLTQALVDAGVPHTVETYANAYHGFAVPDMPVYNPEAAERHWAAVLNLFGATL